MTENNTTPIATVAPYRAPKNTFTDGANDNESRGIVEASIFDDAMLNVIVDTTKHTAFLNAKGTEQTLVKTGKIRLDNGKFINLTYGQEPEEYAAKRLAKDIKQKVRRVMRGKATAEDIKWLIRNGFENDTPGREGTLDVGKVESKEADYKAAEVAERAKTKMAQNNGSLQARVNAVLEGKAKTIEDAKALEAK